MKARLRTERVKRAAHGWTLAAVGWMLFSLFGVFDWTDAHRSWARIDGNAVPTLVIWGIQLLLIALAVVAWAREQARETLWIETDPEFMEAFETGGEETVKRLLVRSLYMVPLGIILFFVEVFFGLRPAALGVTGTIWLFAALTLLALALNIARYARLRWLLKHLTTQKHG